MNRYALWLGIAGGFFPMAGDAAPTLFADGVTFDSTNSSFLAPYTGFDRTNLELSTYNGGLFLHSAAEESSRGEWNGGITMMANPVSVVLSTAEDFSNTDRGKFAVWGDSEYGSSSAKPFFEIKSPENTAAFDSVNVTVTNGSLSVGGSPVLTAGGLNAALSMATPPTSAAWTAAYVPRGNVSLGASLATGGAAASGTASVAHGGSSTYATGDYSSAFGPFAMAIGDFSVANGSYAEAEGVFSSAHGADVHAWGDYSLASGFANMATGDYSTARGEWVTASGDYSTASGIDVVVSGKNGTAFGESLLSNSHLETVFGRFNKTQTATPTSWVATDALFRVGNGLSNTDKSDAVTVLKNGEMTVTNKAWKANSSTPLADPTPTDDSGGNALVVDGHTKLNGKVEITVPQGDISMGIYQ